MLPRRELFRQGLGAGLMLLLAGCGPSTQLLNNAFASAPTPACDPEFSASPDLLRHLLNRCTYGVRAGEQAALIQQGFEPWIEQQLATSADPEVERLLDDFSVLSLPAGEAYEYKTAVIQQEMTAATLLRAVYSRQQLFEVLVGVWRDHFNVCASKAECTWLIASYERDVLRQHALGNWRDLLRASILHPAMLWYLDGRSNQAKHPNENHARELLELHALGVDAGYTQTDVMELARALSGWTVRPKNGFMKGRVEFHAPLHDDGAKLLLGQRIPPGLGAGDIDRVLDLLCTHPAAARHVARRLCRRFIADDPPQTAIDAVAQTFRDSHGDLKSCIRTLLHHPSFQDPAIRLAKLKRPIHYVASSLRILGTRTRAEPALLSALQRLGEIPWQHPTPEGYAERASAWTGTLWWRWRCAWDLSQGTTTDVDPALAFGRSPTPAELTALSACTTSTERCALLLGSPAFQRC